MIDLTLDTLQYKVEYEDITVLQYIPANMYNSCGYNPKLVYLIVSASEILSSG